MNIAIYHFNVKVVSRGKGASAVAKAAYISGEKIRNEHDGVTHDYRKKSEVVHKEILLPDNAPPEYQNRSVLWNAVETAETRKNSQTAKHIDAALPVEISREEQIDLVRNFCKQCFVSRGMCVDFAIHDKKAEPLPFPQPLSPDNQLSGSVIDKSDYSTPHNPHVHILINTRRVDENGFTKKERAWNDKSLLLEWRKLWADWCNHKLYFVSGERIDHRSYAAQGIDKIPQKHLGAAACAIERKGFKTDKGSHNRKVTLLNAENEIQKLEQQFDELQKELRENKKEIIETELGCPLSEVIAMEVDNFDLEQFLKLAEESNIRCTVKKRNDGKDCVFFAKHYKAAVEALYRQVVEKQTAPKQKQDKPAKKRKSL